MIDSIKILVYRALVSIRENKRIKYQGTGEYHRKKYWDYRIKSKKGNHNLRIRVYADHYTIEGSLRKWYLGEYSYDDLTKTQVEEVCMELATLLKVPYDELYQATIVKIEIGMTFTLQGAICNDIIRKTSSYSTMSNPKRYLESITFEGQDYKFILYDKGQEILSNKPKEGFILLSNKLRIELTLKDKKAIDGKLDGINTIAEFIERYRFIVVKFLIAIGRIKFQSGEQHTNVSKSCKNVKELKRHLTRLGARAIGLQDIFACINQFTCSSQNRYKHKNEIKTLMTELDELDNYGFDDFWSEIKREIQKVLREQCPYPVLP